MEIASQHSLGVEAYLERARGLPDERDSDGRSSSPILTSTSSASTSEDDERCPVDSVLAAHVVNGKKHILIDWEGHTIPTWQPDDGTVPHSLTCATLRSDLKDDDREFSSKVGPETYALFAGSFNALYCCDPCTIEDNDGWNYQVYVDASRFGNVRSLHCL